MPTYWMSALGTDTNSGTNYALAKKTLAGAIPLIDTGDTLNIVNDGTHLMLSLAEASTGAAGDIDGDLRCRGTSWVDFGFHFRGTDSGGDPALATIAADSGAGRVYGILRITDRPAFCTIEGLKIDWSSIVADVTNRYMVGGGGVGGNSILPLRIKNCMIVGSVYGGTATAGLRQLADSIGGGEYVTETEGTEVSRCVFYNTPTAVGVSNWSSQPVKVHHNVFIIATDDAAIFGCLGVAGDNLVGDVEGVEVYHNTFYEVALHTTDKINPKVVVLTSNRTDIAVHSNLMYLQPAADVDAGEPFSSYLHDNTGAYGGSGTRGTMGYSVFALGTNFPALSGVAAGGFYDDVFAVASATVAATQVYATDNVVTNATPDTLYNGTGAWTWTTPDGYDMDLPMDMRPLILRTAAYSNAVPGAIPDSISTVTAFPDTYAVTAGNSLVVAAPGVMANDIVTPVDVINSSLVTNVAIGSLVLSSDGGFTYTPPISFSGTVTFTYYAYCASALSNVTTATITVDPYPIPPDDVDEDISYGNLVDTLPFFRPVLKADLSAMVRVHRNTNRNHIDLRHYLKDRIHWESSHRVCEVLAGARKVLTLGGVHRAAGLILETDTTVNATVVHYNGVTDVDFGVTVADCLMIDKANVRRVIINNTSSSTATVHMAVYD